MVPTFVLNMSYLLKNNLLVNIFSLKLLSIAEKTKLITTN